MKLLRAPSRVLRERRCRDDDRERQEEEKNEFVENETLDRGIMQDYLSLTAVSSLTFLLSCPTLFHTVLSRFLLFIRISVLAFQLRTVCLF